MATLSSSSGLYQHPLLSSSLVITHRHLQSQHPCSFHDSNIHTVSSEPTSMSSSKKIQSDRPLDTDYSFKRPFPKRPSHLSNTNSPSSSGFPPTHAMQIKMLNSMGNYEAAISVWKQLKKENPDPDSYAITSILATYRYTNNFGPELMEIVNEVAQKNIVNSYITNQIIDIHSRRDDIDQAIDAFNLLVASKTVIMTYALLSLLEALIRKKDWNQFNNILQHHGSVMLGSDPKFAGRLVTMVTDSNQFPPLEMIIGYLFKFNQAFNSDPFVISYALQKLESYAVQASDSQVDATVEDVERCLQIVYDYLKNLGDVGYQIILGNEAAQNRVDQCLMYWEEMSKKKVYLSSSMYAQIITSVAAFGHIQIIDQFLQQMKKEKVELLPSVYAALTRLYATNMNVAHTKYYFNLLLSRAKGFISPFLFNTVLDLYVDLCMNDDVVQFLEVMKKRSITYNTTTYNSLMRHYINLNDGKKVLELFEKMKALATPNVKSYSLMINFVLDNSSLDRDQRLLRARQLIDEMKDLLHPTPEAIQYIERALDRVGNDLV